MGREFFVHCTSTDRKMFRKGLILYAILLLIDFTNSEDDEDYNYDNYEYPDYEYPDAGNVTDSISEDVESTTQFIGGKKDDEYFCKETKDYRICRHCPSIDDSGCEEPSDPSDPALCVCDNIALYYTADEAKDGEKSGFTGGPNCFNAKGGKDFCFVYKASSCPDKALSEYANQDRFKLWLNSPVYRSEVACKKKDIVQEGSYAKTGNEKILVGVKITDDFLQTEGGERVQFSFGTDEKISTDQSGDDFDYENYDFDNQDQAYELCQQQCLVRKGECGAWSYDASRQTCFLHTVNSCCGQRQKHEENLDFVSGYTCFCWSTHNQCPCKLEDLQKGLNQNETAHSSGATKPLYASSAALLQIDETKLNPDLCQCVWKKKRYDWDCLKPKCRSDGCQNPRRCRS